MRTPARHPARVRAPGRRPAGSTGHGDHRRRPSTSPEVGRPGSRSTGPARRILLTAVVALVAASAIAWVRPAVASVAGPPPAAPEVFTFAGGKPQEVPVPAGATGVEFELVGGSGGNSAPHQVEAAGGTGAIVRGRSAVSVGAVLTVTVGGRGGDVGSVGPDQVVAGGPGWAAGGGGGKFQGGGGGGASAVVLAGGPIAVAAGGGGVGGTGLLDPYRGGTGGAAGAAAGDGGPGVGPNTTDCRAAVGRGGVELSGPGGAGVDGNLAGGGAGGGGGGGYVGGGGGGAGGLGGCGGGGGGAGLSWVAGAVQGSSITGSPTAGDGTITLTWLPRAAPVGVQVDSPTPRWGAALTVTATVPADATGTVRMVADAGGNVVDLGTVPVPSGGTAGTVTSTVPASMLGVGAHRITAQYSGDPQYQAATSAGVDVTVQQDVPNLHLVADRTTVRVGQTPELTAVLPGDATGTVTFAVVTDTGDEPIGTVQVVGGQASLTAPEAFATLGLRRVRATSSGDAVHAAATSPTLLISVVESVISAPAPADPITDASITYEFADGVPQQVDIPVWVTSVRATVIGGSGGKSLKAVGGPGAVVSGLVRVTGGDVLTVTVGGRGGDSADRGVGAGGQGWATGGPGDRVGGSAGGGGASALVGPQGPLLVAAGGGGAGGQGEFQTDAYRGGAGGAGGPTAGNGERGSGPADCRGVPGTGGTEPAPTGGTGGTASAAIDGGGGGGGGGVRGGSGGGAGRLGGCGGGGGGAGTSVLDAGVLDGSITAGASPAGGTGAGRVVLTFLPQPTVMTVAVSEDTPRWGEVLTVTATLPASATGSVRFFAGAEDLGTAEVADEGTAATAAVTVATSALGPGSTTITADYIGDDDDQPATATTVTTVAPGRPAIELLADPTTVRPGAAPRLTAVLPGNATGTIRFVSVSADTTTEIGRATISGGLATVTGPTGFGAPGGIRVRADYDGEGVWGAATSLEPLVTVSAADGAPSSPTSGPPSTPPPSSPDRTTTVATSTDRTSAPTGTTTSSTATELVPAETTPDRCCSTPAAAGWPPTGLGTPLPGPTADLAVTGAPLVSWLVAAVLLLLVGGAVVAGPSVRDRLPRRRSH